MADKGIFVIGLTGSLAMGKSATAKMFAEAGVPVHDADATVHRLYEGDAVAPIEAAFPGITADGKVDREKLGQRVLGNDLAMRRLEQIVHPLVRKAEEGFLEEAERKGAKVAVLDIPLLYETQGDRRCDAVVLVSAPPELQRARAFERPGMSEQKFEAILAKQVPDTEKRRRADFVVDSSRGLDHARAQVRDILARVATMSKKRR
jgi:dephospho-CoA kinase